MEQKIVQALCPDKPVRLIGCNGDDVGMDVIAKRISPLMRLLKNFFPIVILLDRERRAATCEELIEELTQELTLRGHADQFVIGMPDRTIESWILANWERVRSAFPDLGRPVADNHEGKHGKSEVKKLMPEDLIYHETTIGAELFLASSAVSIYSTSSSFKAFVDRLQLKCRWLAAINPRFHDNFNAASPTTI